MSNGMASHHDTGPMQICEHMLWRDNLLQADLWRVSHCDCRTAMILILGAVPR